MSLPTEQVSVTHFKAHCLEMLNDVHAGKYELLLTKRGKPYAKVTSQSAQQDWEAHLKANNYYRGIFKGNVVIHGDIVGSLEDEWEVNKD